MSVCKLCLVAMGAWGVPTPLARAYLSITNMRSLVLKYGFSAYSGVVAHIRWHLDGLGFGASMSVRMM